MVSEPDPPEVGATPSTPETSAATVDEPAVDEPTVDEPAVDEPAVDEPAVDKERAWERLDALAHELDHQQIEVFVEQLTTSEAAQAFSHLSEEERAGVLSAMDVAHAADLIERLPQAQAAQILEGLEPAHAASILEEIPEAGLVDLFAEIDEQNAEPILQAMEPEFAHSVRRLARYDSTCAGGLMETEYLDCAVDSTIAEVRALLDSGEEDDARVEIQYVYVLGPRSRLLGVLPVRALIFAKRAQLVKDCMIDEPTVVLDTASLDELSELFRRHRYLALPVVSKRRRLLGVVARDEVEKAQAARLESDHMKSQGIVREELRSMPFLRRASRRLSWLSSNILLNFVAASVIALYQDTLTAVIALAVFLPIISDMSGCSGNQAVAVSMRELSLGVIASRDVWFVWLKEASVGLLNGSVLGLLLGGAAWLWKGNAWLGLVVGCSLALNTLIAVSLGGCLPLVLRRLGFDPAVASGPLLTTVTDLCGFFLVLSLASTMLHRLA